MKLLTRISAITLTLVMMIACTKGAVRDIHLAEKEVQSGRYRTALSLLDRAIARQESENLTLSALRKAVHLAHIELKDYKKSVDYYKEIIIHSNDSYERLQSQKKIAEIYFYNIQDYELAIKEYSKLLLTKSSFSDMIQYRLNLSKAYFYKGLFIQAKQEVDEILSSPLQEEVKFEAQTLKGNIHVALKDYKTAQSVFESLMKNYPERAAQQNTAIQLAISLEEGELYSEAIAALEKIQHTYKPAEYIELKIKRLKERMKNKPGARGMRK